MSLETAIERLAMAIEKLASAQPAAAAPPAPPEPKPEKAKPAKTPPKPEPEPTPDPEPELDLGIELDDAPAPEPPSEEETMSEMKKVLQIKGKRALANLLAEFGATKFSDIPVDKRAKLIERGKQIMGA